MKYVKILCVVLLLGWAAPSWALIDLGVGAAGAYSSCNTNCNTIFGSSIIGPGPGAAGISTTVLHFNATTACPTLNPPATNSTLTYIEGMATVDFGDTNTPSPAPDGNPHATFSWTVAHTAIQQWSVRGTLGTQSYYDDGSGNLLVNAVTKGTVNYTTGAMTLSVSAFSPPTGTKALTNYRYGSTAFQNTYFYQGGYGIEFGTTTNLGWSGGLIHITGTTGATYDGAFTFVQVQPSTNTFVYQVMVSPAPSGGTAPNLTPQVATGSARFGENWVVNISVPSVTDGAGNDCMYVSTRGSGGEWFAPWTWTGTGADSVILWNANLQNTKIDGTLADGTGMSNGSGTTITTPAVTTTAYGDDVLSLIYAGGTSGTIGVLTNDTGPNASILQPCMSYASNNSSLMFVFPCSSGADQSGRIGVTELWGQPPETEGAETVTSTNSTNPWIVARIALKSLYPPLPINIGSYNPGSLAVGTKINVIPHAVTLPGPTANLDMSVGAVQTFTMTGNVTGTVINITPGAVASHFYICQDSSGSRAMTFSNTIRWPGGVTPTQTSTANKCDDYSFVSRDGTELLGYFTGNL